MPENHIICVGAVYIDTILTVPHYPNEDEKLRAKGITRRRGGNTPNTLEVLTQLLEHDPEKSKNNASHLHLVSILPAKNSEAVKFVRDSLPTVNIDSASIFREDHREAASSYIIQSQETLSRTIVSVNDLPEMMEHEFIAKMEENARAWWDGWFHFEGRIPDVILPCTHFLRNICDNVTISVECEKPERTEMATVAKFAHVVFYSKLWAQKNGYSDPRSFLEAQIPATRVGAVLCCTWGAGGATAVKKGDEHIWAHADAWKVPGSQDKPVVDTIGAGDTFIAGMLFALKNHHDWTLARKLEFANQLAGRKVLQEGFDNLGRSMWELGSI
ncbi:ketohexokinase [Pyrenochaeta sp. MPI-SDFR-AT-0127]|nr:ketohexokinase [Pyrenochaeta sp. MPI-SDFR-AT-0127]